jgi:hypothetical protein
MTPLTSVEPVTTRAAALNRSCFCVGVDATEVYRNLAAVGAAGVTDTLKDTHPGLFSSQAVFVSRQDADAMQALVGAVEAVVALPAFQAAALADAPAIAGRLRRVPAVLHGFDFHLTEQGPRLIEINTNAGGVALAAASSQGLRSPCPLSEALGTVASGEVHERLWQMFLNVWRQVRGYRPLAHIAIVDEHPTEQYLYPEFLLFQALFQRHGVAATIVDPRELEYAGGSLRCGPDVIDLVYNRLTDFYLQAPALDALREAALGDAVVLTPDPRAHALYANKRNLALLTDVRQLRRWGVPDATIETLLRGIPPTEIVCADAAERLWSNRKRLFFKPARGYGSRGSYRGDKLTRGRFGDVVAGDYVAQALIPPGARTADGDSPAREFRFDVRNYVYQGESLLLAARLYQGQTTNFRTPGGGFAPVLHPLDHWRCPPIECG